MHCQSQSFGTRSQIAYLRAAVLPLKAGVQASFGGKRIKCSSHIRSLTGWGFRFLVILFASVQSERGAWVRQKPEEEVAGSS